MSHLMEPSQLYCAEVSAYSRGPETRADRLLTVNDKDPSENRHARDDGSGWASEISNRSRAQSPPDHETTFATHCATTMIPVDTRDAQNYSTALARERPLYCEESHNYAVWNMRRTLPNQDTAKFKFPGVGVKVY